MVYRLYYAALFIFCNNSGKSSVVAWAEVATNGTISRITKEKNDFQWWTINKDGEHTWREMELWLQSLDPGESVAGI